MPELPEAETVARTLYPHIRDCVITSTALLLTSTLHPLSLPISLLENTRISRTWRRGKLIILDLDIPANRPGQPSYLLFHLRMTGRLFTRSGEAEPGKFTRAIFNLGASNGETRTLFFDDMRTFGKIMAANDSTLQKWDFWRELGPEPLEIGAKEFSQQLQGRRAIKTALLDQKVIAGIGNIYADEALFDAGINPLAPVDSLGMDARERLLTSLQSVLRRSISQCGSSIRDYRDADGNAGSFQNSFSVYGRGGQNCINCGEVLQKTRLGGRTTVYCPHCQN